MVRVGERVTFCTSSVVCERSMQASSLRLSAMLATKIVMEAIGAYWDRNAMLGVSVCRSSNICSGRQAEVVSVASEEQQGCRSYSMSDPFGPTTQCWKPLCVKPITSLHVAGIADMVQTSEISLVNEATRPRSLWVDLESRARKLLCSACVLFSQPQPEPQITNRHH